VVVDVERMSEKNKDGAAADERSSLVAHRNPGDPDGEMRSERSAREGSSPKSKILLLSGRGRIAT